MSIKSCFGLGSRHSGAKVVGGYTNNKYIGYLDYIKFLKNGSYFYEATIAIKGIDNYLIFLENTGAINLYKYAYNTYYQCPFTLGWFGTEYDVVKRFSEYMMKLPYSKLIYDVYTISNGAHDYRFLNFSGTEFEKHHRNILNFYSFVAKTYPTMLDAYVDKDKYFGIVFYSNYIQPTDSAKINFDFSFYVEDIINYKTIAAFGFEYVINTLKTI
jgi:hypothetical protein